MNLGSDFPNAFTPWAYWTEEQRQAFYERQREETYRPYGGKLGYDQAMAQREAARRSMALPPSLGEILARLWAAYVGESWDTLTDAERLVRIDAMKTEIARAS